VLDRRTGFVVSDVAEAAAAVDRIGSIDRAACRRRVEERFTADRMADGYAQVYSAVTRAST
jgi:glycosyltransferase involved in cell wall biosynthesis